MTDLPEKWGDPHAPKPTEPGLAKKVRDQAAEIERLKAELVSTAAAHLHAASQLAQMLEALLFFRSVIKSGEPWTSCCEDIYNQALATGAGKEAAAVLEAAEALTAEWPEHLALHKSSERLRRSVRAYRAKMEGDK